jgi:16S rRNA (uracil1498-N3)-methyltransferase
MHRFHLPPEQCQDELTLTDAEGHHAISVLRVQSGDQVSVLDGAGREMFCVVRNVERKTVKLAIEQTETSPAPRCPVTLVQAIPKGKLFETILQKATELGAARIIPLLSERVVAHLDDEGVKHKHEKWQQTAIEAIKQCGQRWLPQVEPPITLPALLARNGVADLALVGSLRRNARHPREYFQSLPKSVRLWIGPEGDFAPAEIDAIEASGAFPITFGPLVLRSDTAAIYALSFVNYELQAADQKT